MIDKIVAYLVCVFGSITIGIMAIMAITAIVWAISGIIIGTPFDLGYYPCYFWMLGMGSGGLTVLGLLLTYFSSL